MAGKCLRWKECADVGTDCWQTYGSVACVEVTAQVLTNGRCTIYRKAVL